MIWSVSLCVRPISAVGGIAALICFHCFAQADELRAWDFAAMSAAGPFDMTESDRRGVSPLPANDLQTQTGATAGSEASAARTLDEAQPVVADGSMVGEASFYDYPGKTASGEPYDPSAFTAAVHLSIRHEFGGIRFGTKYQPAYGIAEYGGKRLVLKFNDVGPLRAGRLFDLSRAAMAYFGGLERGVLANVKVTRLPLGRAYATGPLLETQVAQLQIDR